MKRSWRGGSWAALLVGRLLLLLGQEVGLLLVFPGAGYWASYYLSRSQADLTA